VAARCPTTAPPAASSKRVSHSRGDQACAGHPPLVAAGLAPRNALLLGWRSVSAPAWRARSAAGAFAVRSHKQGRTATLPRPWLLQPRLTAKLAKQTANGDYFGRTVNIAARLTDYARPGEVLVSDQVVADTDTQEAVRFEPVGPLSLKGLSAPVTLYNAVHARRR
jgi:hypothetical protein